MDSKSSLVLVVETLTKSKMFCRLGIDFITKGLVLDYSSFVNILAGFTIARLLFEQRIFFDELFWFKVIV